MISGGNATVYVSDIDAAIRFYTELLGLKLTNRFGGHWATIEAGPSYWTSADEVGAGLVIGLHPRSPKHPAPGTMGAVGFGLETYEPIEDVIGRLAERGVRTRGDIVRFEAGNCVRFEDPDGTASYVQEWTPEMVPEADTEADGDSAEEATAILSGGHALVYVSNMDNAVRFYTEVLGLSLTYRYEDKIAFVEACRDLLIALHPRSPMSPEPGTKGSVTLGLTIDEPIQRVVSRLVERGVRLAGDVVPSERGSSVEIEDLDGNALYLWEPEVTRMPENDLVSRGSTTP